MWRGTCALVQEAEPCSLADAVGAAATRSTAARGWWLSAGEQLHHVVVRVAIRDR